MQYCPPLFLEQKAVLWRTEEVKNDFIVFTWEMKQAQKHNDV